jgi:hypothetical protein
MFSTSYPDPFLQWYCGSVGFFSFQMALLKLIATWGLPQCHWSWCQARQLSLTLGTRSTKSSVECLIEMSMLVYRFIVYFVQYTVLNVLIYRLP